MFFMLLGRLFWECFLFILLLYLFWSRNNIMRCSICDVLLVIVLKIWVFISMSIITKLQTFILVIGHYWIRTCSRFTFRVVKSVILECIWPVNGQRTCSQGRFSLVLDDTMLVKRRICTACDVVIHVGYIKLVSLNTVSILAAEVVRLLIKLLDVRRSLVFVVILKVLECVMLHVLHVLSVFRFSICSLASIFVIQLSKQLFVSTTLKRSSRSHSFNWWAFIQTFHRAIIIA